MTTFDAYVERGVAMAYDDGCAAWTFDLERWGVCGQGVDERSALDDLARQVGRSLTVRERIDGDEQAFTRDGHPAAAAERLLTHDILIHARAQTRKLVRESPDDVLDWDDPGRRLASYASWRTLRQMAWHLADTESRYYLPSLGLPDRPRDDDLLEELERSGRHVTAQLATMPADLRREDAGQVWTSVKLLRRLAWHERSELHVMVGLTQENRARADKSRLPEP